MKRELIAIALLLTLLVLSLANVRYIEDKSAVLMENIDAAETLLESGDTPGAENAIRVSLDGWLGWKSYTHIMLRHSEIDAITDAYYELLIGIENGGEAPKAAFGALRQKLLDLSEKERVTAGTLF
jgi:hypothetical protein